MGPLTKQVRENMRLRKENAELTKKLAKAESVARFMSNQWERIYSILLWIPGRDGGDPEDHATTWIAKHIKRDKKRAKRKAARREYHICITCSHCGEGSACGGVSLDREPRSHGCKNWVSRDD